MSEPAASGGPAGPLPRALHRYLLAVSIAGPIVALLVALTRPIDLAASDLLPLGMLAAMALLGVLLPLRIRERTLVNVVGAAYLALILVSPVALPGLIAVAVALAGRVVRRRRDALEVLFNVGQTALYVTAGAITFAVTSAFPWGPEITGIGPVPAVVCAALMVYLANFTVVTIAVALQTGAAPLRVWRKNIGHEFLTELALFGIGVVAALLAVSYPWALPVLVLPVLLVYRSLQHSTRLQLDVERALAHLVELLEQRDSYTAGHSERVALMARTLALRLGLTADEARSIESAGRVHDIGKLVIDPAILQKTGPLTDVEMAEMRLHAGHGASIMEQFAPSGDGHRSVRHHHEHWDGTGYPDGLQGEQIPFGARILSVADAYDALNSTRPYRRAVDSAQIRCILQQGASTQWDPVVVDELVAWLAETGPAPVPVPACSGSAV
ncbi:MAG: HD-GYP domain-containing protein [Thermomicrobiales bacterium]